MGSLSKDVQIENNNYTLKGGENEFLFKQTKMLNLGYYEIVSWETFNESNPDVQTLELDQELAINKTELLTLLTEAPSYLTESDLLGLMEQNGIGTDASMSQHINNIILRKYVTVLKKNRQLIPTKLGTALIHAYKDIDPELVAPELRRNMEQQISSIAKGEMAKDVLIQNQLAIFKDKYIKFIAQSTRLDFHFDSIQQFIQDYSNEEGEEDNNNGREEGHSNRIDDASKKNWNPRMQKQRYNNNNNNNNNNNQQQHHHQQIGYKQQKFRNNNNNNNLQKKNSINNTNNTTQQGVQEIYQRQDNSISNNQNNTSNVQNNRNNYQNKRNGYTNNNINNNNNRNKYQNHQNFNKQNSNNHNTIGYQQLSDQQFPNIMEQLDPAKMTQSNTNPIQDALQLPNNHNQSQTKADKPPQQIGGGNYQKKNNGFKKQYNDKDKRKFNNNDASTAGNSGDSTHSELLAVNCIEHQLQNIKFTKKKGKKTQLDKQETEQGGVEQQNEQGETESK